MRFFDERASVWDKDHRCPDEETRIPLVMPYFALPRPPARVLDIGCGTGKLVPWIRPLLGRTGLLVESDFSRGMLRAGRAKGFPPDVVFSQTDAQMCCFKDRSFDAVVCFALFPHLENQPAALAGFRRLLGPGGLLLIAHTMGRGELNALFRCIGGPVARDFLPDGVSLTKMLSAAGFRRPMVIDRPHVYVAQAWA